MTPAEYAAHRGVTTSYIGRMRRRGHLVLTADGLVDVAASDALLDGITNPVRGGKRPGSGRPRSAGSAAPAAADGERSAPEPPPARPAAGGRDDLPPAPGAEIITVHEAVRRERLARARMAEIELGEQAKKLTRVDDVNRGVFTLVRQALNQLQGMSGRLAKSLAAEADPFRIAQMIDQDVANICHDMRAAAADLLAEPKPPADDDDDDDASQAQEARTA